MIQKPMLAVAIEDINTLKYPVMCSPKLDGIRCLVVNGQPLSRKFKEIPNQHIRESLQRDLKGLTLDGELMLDGKPFNEISSAVMSEDGSPDFRYHVFDYLSLSDKEPFQQRFKRLCELNLPSYCKIVEHVLVNSSTELLQYETTALASHYEGVMVRSVSSPYKNGRSTLREGYLLKLKQFSDSEAKILNFEEKMHNNNEATIDELGHTKRSTHKENMIPAGTLGAFVVRDLYSNMEFRVATGLDDVLRKQIWLNRDQYLNKTIKYKYQPSGMKDLPRFPVFIGFRDDRDISS
jgi:DNA ligase-1